MTSASCRLYNNIKPPSWLGAGTDFHLFKKGIQPKWEDPQCEAGGKWTILVPRGGSSTKQFLDKFWLHSVRLSEKTRPCRPMRSMPDCLQFLSDVFPSSAWLIRRDKNYVQLLACIGEQFTHSDEICGVVVNMRAKQDKVCRPPAQRETALSVVSDKAGRAPGLSVTASVLVSVCSLATLLNMASSSCRCACGRRRRPTRQCRLGLASSSRSSSSSTRTAATLCT